MKQALDKKRIQFYLWVGLAYSVLWIFIDMHNYPGPFFPRLVNNIWRVCYLIFINFIFFEYSIPFLRRQKYLVLKVFLGILLLWVQMMLYSFGMYAWRLLGIELHIYTPLKVFKSVMQGVANGTGDGVFSLIVFGLGRHIFSYLKLVQTTQQLRIEKQQAELNYLRSQTNPHFLFNTLNNIYALARDKSDLAPDAVLRLSKILRFMLYETAGEYISIEQEMKIISDYIALEQLRYDESLRIHFNHDVEEMKQALPPLLLIPLVENAFKHGVSETRVRPFVDIHLSCRQRQLTFMVKNSTGGTPAQEGAKENIGLSNLRRQLELLYKDYHLSVQQEEFVFTALLKINLSSHV